MSLSENYKADGFFAFRTPLYPFDRFTQLAHGMSAADQVRAALALENATNESIAQKVAPILEADRARATRSLQDVCNDNTFMEAIFIASPSLFRASSKWLAEHGKQAASKVEMSLMKYFSRACTRCTPFGLFAGCSTGTLGVEDRIELDAIESYGRRTRLDADYLFLLAEAANAARDVRNELLYYPNSSLYCAAGRFRFTQARLSGRSRSYYLVAIEQSDYLCATIDRANTGATVDDLARCITAHDPDVTMEEAIEFVHELIDTQVLTSRLWPTVTGKEATDRLIEDVRSLPSLRTQATTLGEVRDHLTRLDNAGLGAKTESYQNIAAVLEPLGAPTDIARLFQVDMTKPARATLSAHTTQQILQGVEILHRISIPTPDPMDDFRAAFSDRYGDGEVPLTDVLDEDIGIGFRRSDHPTSANAPLLDGIPLAGAVAAGDPAWRARDAYLLDRLSGMAPGEEELPLTDRDIAAIANPTPKPLPDAFHAMVKLSVERETGRISVLIKGVGGPSGANLLGRFCHADPKLRQHVEQHLKNEERFLPEVLFAEIVHLPEGRFGNILSRPLLRTHEIRYLGESGAEPSRQIGVQDLLVSVRGKHVTLRSKALNRVIVPRLTNAHNFTRGQGLYRFLSSLQGHGVGTSGAWRWGALESMRFLPRVTYDGIVFSMARWAVSKEETPEIFDTDERVAFVAIQRFRIRRGLPRLVSMPDGDNELTIDLDNPLSVASLLRLARNRPRFTLTEILPQPAELCARGPEGQFACEVVVPFIKENRTSLARTQTPRLRWSDASSSKPIRRSFPPGSEWLYFKLYCSVASSDGLLRDVVLPLVRRFRRDGVIDRWFFIRYADPDPHLRIRFHGDPKALTAVVALSLVDAVEHLSSNSTVWRIQLDTYERELLRYGGSIGMELSERVFEIDSDCVGALVDTFEGDQDEEARWQLGLVGMDGFLEGMGFDLKKRKEMATTARLGFGEDYGCNSVDGKRALGAKYRERRRVLTALWSSLHNPDFELAPRLEILRHRDERLRPVLSRLRGELSVSGFSIEDLCASYIHMFVNRLLPSGQRPQEMVLYEMLSRHYAEMIALSAGNRARGREHRR